jgi:hypothetical protein
MPINPSALSSPEPDPAPSLSPEQTRALSDHERAVAAQFVAEHAAQDQEPPKRTRRSRAQMIADAVVPADAEMVEVKDVATGAKVLRAWREAVQLVKTGAVEFADRTMKYALQKEEQVAAQSAFGQSAQGTDPQPVATGNVDQPILGGDEVPAASSPQNVPPDAKLGDEVRVGAETYRVGHGGVLTTSPVADAEGNVIRPARRWQRELGAGPNGAWQQTPLTAIGDPRPIFEREEVMDATPGKELPVNQQGSSDPPALLNTAAFSEPTPAPTNGNGVTTKTERLPRETQDLGDGSIKIGTGILEKIGLPDYSSLQIGPITASRVVFDDGRRTTVTFDDGRAGEVITAAAEGFELLDNTVEYIAKRFRGQLVSFLESTGALKQPVS